MIRKHADFRVQMDVDFLVNNWKPSEVVEKYFSGGLCGFDREGSPLWWEVVGDLDPPGLMRSERPGGFLRSKVRELELMLAECQRQTHLVSNLGRQVGSMVLIVDLNNLSRRHLWRPFLNSNLEVRLTHMLRMFEANYPECLKRMYIVKAPRIFSLFYTLMTPIIGEGTKSKIQVLGSDWQEVLLSQIDASEVPEYYGGTRTGPDGDPRCGDKVRNTGTVTLTGLDRTPLCGDKMRQMGTGTGIHSSFVLMSLSLPVSVSLYSRIPMYPVPVSPCPQIRFPTEVPLHYYAARDLSYESSVTVGLGSSHTHSLHVASTGSVIQYLAHLPSNLPTHSYTHLTTHHSLTASTLHPTAASSHDISITIQHHRGGGVVIATDILTYGSFCVSHRWSFQTESHDIGFGVSMQREGGEDTRIIIAVQRHNTHLIPEHGTLTAQEPGLYSLLFDNSYSWIHSKNLQFTVKLQPPGSETA
ncbi:SEC14-like protein 2 [Petromyzon marinus]|uniref:SEC14-like protein 2 n=1 Tax=Petromyzon marinus TaxID=7757 RepID=UPI003F71B742